VLAHAGDSRRQKGAACSAPALRLKACRIQAGGCDSGDDSR
jgi:hypothetical protein